ncbi:MAG: 30S ribosomal protein S17 [Candidatus Sericytochromatia bacterium]|nr:30S ribosomal protein S17 [Candidatus Sericytochromatia bacterium]
MPKRILSGKVVSDKMDKTGVLAVKSVVAHRLYKKVHKITKKYKFHDEKNEVKTGDVVEIEESRPYSREKVWRLFRVIKKVGDEI